jgi:hypothetical protein
MIQLQKLGLRVPVRTTAVRPLFSSQTTPDTELYNLFHSLPDYIEAKPEMYRVENLEAINKSMQLLKLVNMVGHFKGL